ncbi:TrbI/VirB10 family protein [Sphingomonas colocasiae]
MAALPGSEPPPMATEDPEAAERERKLAEQRQMRGAPVLVGIGNRPALAADGLAPAPFAPPTAGEGSEMQSQDSKRRFASQADNGPNVSAHRVEVAPSPWTISAGSIIAASLVTGLNSDLPGLVIAQVTEDARDSVTGRTVLIPQGARVIGEYDSVVAFGQKRALLKWQRILFPDGSSIRLDNLPAADPSGYAGLEDKVDFHEWQLLKGIALSTLLGVGTELSISGESDLVRALRESAQQNAANAGQQITSKNLNVQPTLKVRPGASLRVIVHRDIILKPWRR